MADPLTIQELRGLVLSAQEIKVLTEGKWPDPLVEDYLNIIENIITVAETVNNIVSETIEEITTNFTDGSIPFAESNLLTENNTNLFWDNISNILNVAAVLITSGTASRLLSFDATKKITSVSDLTDWIAGTTNQVTVTDDTDGTVTLSLPQDIDTGADATFGTVTLSDLTASRLLSLDAGKKSASVANLASWIAGTTNQITVTDDADGTITLSLPQDIDTNADVEFDTLTLGDMTTTYIPFFGVGGLIDEDATFLWSSGLHLKADSLKTYWGAGDDSSVYYDGTDMNIKTSEVAASDLLVTCGANKTIELQNVVYNDVFHEIRPKTTGAGRPSLALFSGFTNVYQMAVADLSELENIKIPHDWKEGTQIDIHIHWGTNGVDGTNRGVKWQIDYVWANKLVDGGTTAFAGASTTASTETQIPASTPDKTHMYTQITTFTPAGGKIDAVLIMALTRIASVTDPTPTNDPWVFGVGIHYQVDTIGSRQINTK